MNVCFKYPYCGLEVNKEGKVEGQQVKCKALIAKAKQMCFKFYGCRLKNKSVGQYLKIKVHGLYGSIMRANRMFFLTLMPEASLKMEKVGK